MSPSGASTSGTFRTCGDIDVNRPGSSATRLTGEAILGEPADRSECVRVVSRLPELGVTLIDTADTYSAEWSKRLIRNTVSPGAVSLRSGASAT